MNLENLYGSQESLVKVFESALQENEPLEVFTRLVTVYQQSKKFDVSVLYKYVCLPVITVYIHVDSTSAYLLCSY